MASEAESSTETVITADAAVFRTTVRGTRFRSIDDVVIGDDLRCRREPSNKVDPNAIAVHRLDSEETHIGYLPREISAELVAHVDDGRVALLPTVTSVLAGPSEQMQVQIDVRISSKDLAMLMKKIKEAAEGSLSGRILRENLLLMLEHVESLNSHILSAAERWSLEKLKQLIRPALEVLLRLYLRKSTWFRIQNLTYFDQHRVDQLIRELVVDGFLCSTKDLSVEKRRNILVQLLTVAEMKQLLRCARNQCINCRITGNKEKLHEEITDILNRVRRGLFIHDNFTVNCVQRGSFMAEIDRLVGTCVSVTPRVVKALKTSEQLFFLDDSHDLSTFLLRELDIIKWPQYQSHPRHPIFSDRPSFDAYTNALQQAAILDAAVDSGDSAAVESCLEPVWSKIEANQHKINWTCNGRSDALPNNPTSGIEPVPLFLARFSALWVYVRMASVGVSYLERRKQYREATDRLRMLLGGNACPSTRGLWWSRLIIDLNHLKRPNEALETCISALADDWVRHGNRIFIKRHLLKLSKPPRRWKLPHWAPQVSREPKQIQIHATPLNNEQGHKSEFLGRFGQPVSVEQLALEYYEEAEHGEWQGLHTEGSLWHTLFGVLFWDVIFAGIALYVSEFIPIRCADIDDVFRSPFQTEPFDFDTDAFYLARKDQIHYLLDQIRQGQGRTIFTEQWKTHRGELCHGVNWDRYSIEQIVEIMECIHYDNLASICQILAEDFKAVSGGLPDLFLWNRRRQESKLVEVKGPNDRLSDQQRAWITVLTEIGFQVEVFKIKKYS